MPFIVGPGGDLVGPGGGTVGPGVVPPALPSSEIHQFFDIGSRVGSAVHQLFDILATPVSSEIHQRFSIIGLVSSEIHQLFDIESTYVSSEIHQLFDILDVASPPAPPPGVPPIWHPLMVFDKAGAYLGSIADFNVSRAPVRYLRSRRVTNEGGMTFSVPRDSPDIDLIAADRLVLLQSWAGEEPWAGTISPRDSAAGSLEAECKDPWQLLRDGPAVTFAEEVGDGTPATAIYAKVMAAHNDARAARGELVWDLDLGGSRPFLGDIDFDADTLSVLDKVIERSRTQIAWRARFSGGQLRLTLVTADAFDAGAGATIADGPGGNVVSGVNAIEDPTPLIFGIRLRGSTTELEKCLPDWAKWAAKNVTPQVTVSVDPGAYRFREERDATVDWGLSDAALAAQCNAIVDWITELYHSYLRAIHDIEGRPWHEGWAYLGPPDIYEPLSAGKDSLSRRAWKTRLQLVELLPDQPASAVMISGSGQAINLREWLIVVYNRVTGVQSVGVRGIPTVVGASLIKWNTTGTVTLYKVSGGRIVSRSTLGAGTGAYADPYNIRVYDPVAGRYRNLRRIISGPYALAYYIDPTDADNALIDMGPDAAVSTADGDGSSLIDKIYPFERLAIENYDPRSLGVGQLLARETIFAGAVTTRPRWHVTSFDVGGAANTSLVHGIGATTPGTLGTIEVESMLGFPDPDLEPELFPWTGAIDEGLDEEQFIVRSPADMVGTEWTIVRGANGTAPIIHEAGAPVRRLGPAWDGFAWPGEWTEGDQAYVGADLWPEGAAWAAAELAELSQERVELGLRITHASGDQLTVDYGSSHAVNVASEGKAGRWVGTGRVIGWSTDAPAGTTELVLAWEG